MGRWAGKTTSYRIYCQENGCGAEEVIHEDEIDESEWRVTSKHFHEGYCPDHADSFPDPDEETQEQSLTDLRMDFHEWKQHNATS